ncbi:MAG: hypothetical protein V5A37_01550 [Halobacteriales archaeon]
MSKRCARCGEFNPRRSMRLPGDWVDYLERERGRSSPVGTLVMPLCRECYTAADDLPEEETDEVVNFLDEVDPAALVDEVAG